MARIQPVDPKQATGKTKELLDAVQKKYGMAPNVTRAFANSPAVLEGYLKFSGALAAGALDAKLRERIALMVGESNGCDYCVAAHSAVAKMAGLSEEEVLDSRRGESPDSRSEAALQFARSLVKNRGWVDDEEIERVRNAGFGDGEITEIIANVAINIFTNYFNHVARTEVDFPKAEALATA